MEKLKYVMSLPQGQLLLLIGAVILACLVLITLVKKTIKRIVQVILLVSMISGVSVFSYIERTAERFTIEHNKTGVITVVDKKENRQYDIDPKQYKKVTFKRNKDGVLVFVGDKGTGQVDEIEISESVKDAVDKVLQSGAEKGLNIGIESLNKSVNALADREKKEKGK